MDVVWISDERNKTSLGPAKSALANLFKLCSESNLKVHKMGLFGVKPIIDCSI